MPQTDNILGFPGTPGMLGPQEEPGLEVGMLDRDEAMRQKMQQTMQKRNLAHFSWRDVLGMQPPLDPLGPEPPAWFPPGPAVDPYTGEVSESDVQQTMTGVVDTVLPAGLGAAAWKAMKGQPMRASGGILGGPAFHGSPHRFDKFDIEKIGTGEGAQAYGHGLYFAESPGTAKSYQTALTGPFSNTQNTTDIIGKLPERLRSRDNARKIISQMDEAIQSGDIKDASEYVAGFRVQEELIPAYREAEKVFANKGSFYEVDIPDEQISRMLDWDAPVEFDDAISRRIIDDFPDEAEDIAQITGAPGSGYEGQPESGRSIYQWLSAKLGGDDAASKYLNEAGIPGIRYLDQGSRQSGKGTRNLVLFSDEHINILKINEQPVK